MSYVVPKPLSKSRRVNSGHKGSYDEMRADEIRAGIRYWVGEGLSDREVALKVGVSDRTVLRHRHRHNLPTNFPQKRTQSARSGHERTNTK